MGGKIRRTRMHKVPDEAPPGVELFATAAADGAQSEGPGRMEPTMDLGTVSAPRADSGEREAPQS